MLIHSLAALFLFTAAKPLGEGEAAHPQRHPLVSSEPLAQTVRGTGGSGPPPSQGVQPATKKELPWLNVSGARMRTTLYYGPWQCRREFMNGCQRECASEGYKLMGCMWLADIKFDWEGSLFLFPVPVNAGGRLGIYHCCCDYPTLPKAEKEVARKKWDGIRESFREKWGKQFGEWPASDGTSWPGHHIRDLWHGGHPTDPNNVIPVHPGTHKVFNDEYPACYAGQAPWNAVGPNLPYSDN